MNDDWLFDRITIMIVLFMLVAIAFAMGAEFGTISTISRMRDYVRVASRASSVRNEADIPTATTD